MHCRDAMHCVSTTVTTVTTTNHRHNRNNNVPITTTTPEIILSGVLISGTQGFRYRFG